MQSLADFCVWFFLMSFNQGVLGGGNTKGGLSEEVYSPSEPKETRGATGTLSILPAEAGLLFVSGAAR